MSSRLILHPTTQQRFEQFAAQPSHALLLVGPSGSGKQALATRIASELLGVPDKTLANYPYFLLADAPSASISIETVREQQGFLRLKTIGTGKIRRVMLLPDIERMTVEAQNAILKTLEEPPTDTVLLLTTSETTKLLPTILSRLQTIVVRPPHESALKDYFGERFEKSAVQSNYILSGGLPGLMTALLEQNTNHPLITAVGQAKTILAGTHFERLQQVDSLSKQKVEAKNSLRALQQIARVSMSQAAKAGDNTKVARWHTVLKAVYDAENALQRNANAKLVFTNLMLAL